MKLCDVCGWGSVTGNELLRIGDHITLKWHAQGRKGAHRNVCRPCITQAIGKMYIERLLAQDLPIRARVSDDSEAAAEDTSACLAPHASFQEVHDRGNHEKALL